MDNLPQPANVLGKLIETRLGSVFTHQHFRHDLCCSVGIDRICCIEEGRFEVVARSLFRLMRPRSDINHHPLESYGAIVDEQSQTVAYGTVIRNRSVIQSHRERLAKVSLIASSIHCPVFRPRVLRQESLPHPLWVRMMFVLL